LWALFENLYENIANEQFRKESFYMFNVFPIKISLLNKCQGDIKTLVSGSFKKCVNVKAE